MTQSTISPAQDKRQQEYDVNFSYARWSGVEGIIVCVQYGITFTQIVEVTLIILYSRENEKQTISSSEQYARTFEVQQE